MTNETGLLRNLNLKPGDRVTAAYTTEIKSTNATVVGDSIEYDYGGKVLIDDSSMIYTVTHRAPRTIGTLKEIGAKVGDTVQGPSGTVYTVDQWDLDYSTCHLFTIVSRATTSPVRTVTKKEIVPGVYGKVIVDMLGGIGVSVQELHDADELTAAIATLTEIRDAM